MFLETSSGRKGDKSYITSPKLKPGMRSVKFYYHMHGKTMGILSLEAKKRNRWYTIWHKQGQQHTSQKAAWSQGRANIPAGTTQIRFRGTKGSSWTGDMSIDSVTLSSRTTRPNSGGGSSSTSKGTGNCNFERGMCGWTESGKNAFTRGSRTPSTGTGANKAAGGKYFVFLETSTGHKGDASFFISPKLQPGMRWVQFYYHMHGKHMGTLDLETYTNDYWSKGVWSKTGQQHSSQGAQWSQAIVALKPGTTKVRFRGTKGSDYTGDMSVDQITFSKVKPAVKLLPPSCTFEAKTLCGWTESGKNHWTRGSHTPSGGTGAAKAHAGKWFMFLETSSGRKGDASFLISPKFTGMRSVSFYYHMHGKTMGTLSAEAYTNDYWQQATWSKTGQQHGTQGASWQQAAVDLPQGTTRLRFKGTRGSSYTGDMSIDSVVFSHARAVVPHSRASADDGPCTFEDSRDQTCGWTEAGKNAWTRGSHTPSGGTGASKAHGGKFFMYLETSSGRMGDKSYLISPKLKAGTGSLKFFYHMHGKTMGSLSLQAWQGSSGASGGGGGSSSTTNPYVVPVVTQQSTSAPGHITLEVSLTLLSAAKNVYTLYGDSTYPMVIPPAFQSPGSGALASDIGGVDPQFFQYDKSHTAQFDSWLTIGITKGDTKRQMSMVGIKFKDWTETQGLSVNNGAIFYMNPSSGPSSRNVVVAQLTMTQTACRSATMHARLGGHANSGQDFHAAVDFSAALRSHNHHQPSNDTVHGHPDSRWTTVWRKSGQIHKGAGARWSGAVVSLPPGTTKVRFEGVRGSSFTGDMSIDTVSTAKLAIVSAGGATGTCNFEDSHSPTCGWTLSGKHQWKRSTRTPSSGTGAAKAAGGKYFMFLETSTGVQGDASYMVSPKLDPGMTSVAFYYHMHGKSMGTLVVQASHFSVQPHGNLWDTIWSKSGQQHASQTDAWTGAIVSLPPSTMRIRFKGTKSSSYTGDISIDTIVVKGSAGKIHPVYTGDCKFEKDACGWTESGKNAWTRGTKTPSSSTGPPKAAGGKYFEFLETSTGRRGDASLLISPPLGPGKTTMSFFYHMHGETMGGLELEAKVGARWRRVWGKKGQQQLSQSQPWKRVILGLPPSTTQVRFKGIKGSSYTGDMAVDSIAFTGH
jgi:hypothetical protein